MMTEDPTKGIWWWVAGVAVVALVLGLGVIRACAYTHDSDPPCWDDCAGRELACLAEVHRVAKATEMSDADHVKQLAACERFADDCRERCGEEE